MADAVMIVAHPDDDAGWGGPLQMITPWMNWTVVCVTWRADSLRGQELLAWQRRRGAGRVVFLDLPDDPKDYEKMISSFTPEDVAAALQQSDLPSTPDLIVTHNPIGEYGHPHHITVHHGVMSLYSAREVLMFGHYLTRWDFTIEVEPYVEEAASCFVSQEKVLRHYQQEIDWMRVGRYTWHRRGSC